MNLRQTIASITVFLLVLSNANAQTSTIVGDTYDAEKNETYLILIPNGGVKITGKWTKTSYNDVSRQHFFKNDDGTTLSIAKNLKEKYPFYKKRKSDKEFVIDFVAWDGDFWKQKGLDVTILEDQSDSGFIVWQAKAKGVNTVFLFGAKNGFAYSFSIGSGPWSDPERAAFLSKIYNEN
jgi:hypothetical protein